MPIYEYHCRACGKDFELMRSRAQMDTATKCAHCGSKATKRKLSIFAPVRSTVAAGHEDGEEHEHGADDAEDFDDCC